MLIIFLSIHTHVHHYSGDIATILGYSESAHVVDSIAFTDLRDIS